MNKNLFFAISAVIILSNCAPSVYINKDYAGVSFKDKKLRVIIVDSIKISYDGSMDNEFPLENRLENVKRFIGNALVNAVKDSSIFDSVKLSDLECDTLHRMKLQWKGSDTFSVLVPSSECEQNLDSNEILLLIENTKVESHVWVQVITVYMVPVGAIPHKPLNISSKFVYWDSEKRKPIAWGNAVGSYDQGIAVTMKNWENATRRYGLSAIRKTPFMQKAKMSKKNK